MLLTYRDIHNCKVSNKERTCSISTTANKFCRYLFIYLLNFNGLEALLQVDQYKINANRYEG